jgi:hypothetical protein
MQKMTNRLTIELRRLAYENHDNCVTCGYQFKTGDTSHLGYDKNGDVLYTCDKCSGNIIETGIRQYFTPRPYSLPALDSKLWRYMDFTKYVSMLSTNGLYFTRSDCFEDIFEGAKGLKKNKTKWDNYYLEFFRQAIKNPPKGYDCQLSDDEIVQQATKLLSDLETGGQANKKSVFVSCWHENEFESEAMWRLYSSFLPNAIAVKTSYKSLYEGLGRDPSIQIGHVEYVDLNKNYVGINEAFWRKRLSFQHEREVRALVMDFDCAEQGKVIKCDLTALIEEIFVSPKAPDWFVDLVNDINEKYDLRVKVSSSGLNEHPFF